MSILDKALTRLGKLHLGQPVPPPAAPPPTGMTASPYELPIPYALEEYPRTFLHLLKTSNQVPAQVKSMIELWLDDYDARLINYLHQRYGEGVDQVADMITRSVMAQQSAATEAQAKAVERDVLAEMEEQLKKDSGA